MTITTIWLLVTITSNSASSPSVIAKFYERANCEAAAADMYSQSLRKSRISVMYGICIPAEGTV